LTAGTIPAYVPLQREWGSAVVARNPLYNTTIGQDPLQTFLDAGSNISPTLRWLAIDEKQIFTEAVLPGLKEGKTLESLIPAWQAALEDAAKKVGYTVVNG
jgi:hypothetical protein